jgi:hypothetical protein
MTTERLVVAQDPPQACNRILRGMKSRRNVGHTERWLLLYPDTPHRYGPPLRHIVRRCWRLLAETVTDATALLAFVAVPVKVYGVRTPVGEKLQRYIGDARAICWYHLTAGAPLIVRSGEVETVLAIEPGRMVLLDGRYEYSTDMQPPPDDRYAIAVVWS